MELKDLADPVQVTATPELRKMFESDDTVRESTGCTLLGQASRPALVRQCHTRPSSGAFTNQAQHCASGL